MEHSVEEVEKILKYCFRDKRLLEEALTHSSFSGAVSYERLEFMGDAVLGLAISNHLFLVYPDLDPGQLSLLRAANISTEKLARVSLNSGFYCYVRHNAPSLQDKVREFAKAVSKEDDPVSYGGSVKAPKVLADIAESVAGAVYVDVGYDLEKLWVIFRGILEPLVTLHDLKQQPQPVTMLYEHCQKNGKTIYLKHWKSGSKTCAVVFVDGQPVATASSEQKDIARLNAAKAALFKLTNMLPANDEIHAFHHRRIDGPFEIVAAKPKLHDLCLKNKWAKPEYRIENENGPAHDKKFVCSVQINTSSQGILCMKGDEKPRVKEAENSAASLMIRALESVDYRCNL